MNTLAEVLSSRTRAEVFRLLFGLNRLELHIREISRRSGCSEASVRQEFSKLKRLGLVKARREGNRLYYSADMEHPLFPDIHRMVLKTSGLVDFLRTALDDQEIEFAFVFGSVARGESSSSSDIDLMVIGDIGLRDLAVLLAGVPEIVGRDINPHVMPISEYLKRIANQDHFAVNVLKGPRLFVIGDADEYEAMGE